MSYEKHSLTHALCHILIIALCLTSSSFLQMKNQACVDTYVLRLIQNSACPHTCVLGLKPNTYALAQT